MRDTVVKRRPMIDLEQFERRLRQPNAANRTDEDPLAELARLVGGPDDPYKDDPYKQVFEAQASHRGGGAEEAHDRYEADAWDDAEPQDFEAEEGLGHYAALETEAPANLAPSILRDGAEYAFTADGQSAHWRYENEDEAAVAPEFGYEPEKRSRRPLYVMAAIIIAGIGGIGTSYVLKGGAAPQEIATIKAADGPTKVEPETNAGADAPHQDASILDRTPQAAPVAVADATEQPVDLSRLPGHAAAVAVPPSPAQAYAPAPLYSPEQAAVAPQSIAGLIEPKKVKTVSVRPDGTVLTNDAAPLTPAVAPQAPAHAAGAPAAKASTPKSTARVATTPKPAAAAAATDANPKPVRVADAAEAGAAQASATHSNGGAFAVQLAAPTSEQEARDIQARLMKKYGADIPGFHPAIRRAVSGDKTVYRVRTVGLSKEEATALCQKVQSTGGNCFVAKN